MARKPSFNDFVEELGPEMYYMDGELSRTQAERYWRQVYNQRYGRTSVRQNIRGMAAKGNNGG